MKALLYYFFCVAMLTHWSFVNGVKSQVDSELNILMPILLNDPKYLSLSKLEQYQMFRKIYTFILDKKGLSAYKSHKDNAFPMRTRFKKGIQ